MLANIGYCDVGFSITGEEAVENYKTCTQKPEVIIMDYRMPVMNGIDAMNEILKIDGDTKIIFASADTTMKEKSLSLGAFGFLSKPFKIEELINLINKVINSKQQRCLK